MSDRFGTLAAVVSTEVQARSRRAFLLSLGAALLATFALGGSVVPIAIAGNLLINYAVFLATFGTTLAATLLWQFGGAIGDALAVGGWGRLEAEDHWRALGAGKIPRDAGQGSSWLAAHPEPGRLAPQRLVAQLFAGDTTAANETLSTYPTSTAYERFELANDRWFLDFLAGELPALDEVEAAAANVQDPGERARAAAAAATMRAHAAAVSGGDWVAALAAARQVVGARADGLVWSRYVVPGWTLLMGVAAALIGLGLLAGKLTGVWL
ncbi:MAG: hypothetical protein ABJC24_05595 [Chloroflexota bacterium]